MQTCESLSSLERVAGPTRYAVPDQTKGSTPLNRDGKNERRFSSVNAMPSPESTGECISLLLARGRDAFENSVLSYGAVFKLVALA